MKRWKREILPLLPKPAAEVLERLEDAEQLCEIRLRQDQPMQLVYETTDRIVYAHGGMPMTTKTDIEHLLLRLSDHALYAKEQEMQNGYLTVCGGYRVGLSGRLVGECGTVERFSAVTGLCIRIVREVRGAAEPLLPYITTENRVGSVLLLSPPNCGKTTVLRDLIRIISDGACGIQPQKVGVADERFELCGASDGSVTFDLGVRTDVLCGISKAAAMQRLLTTLSPQVLATDELTYSEDAEALLSAAGSGVRVLATAHADDMEQLRRKPSLFRLLHERVFDRIAELRGRGELHVVRDASGRILQKAGKETI